MRKLQLGDVEVCTSPLSQRSYRAAPAELLLNVTPRNKAAALKTFKQGRIPEVYGLRISGISDLSFLQEFPRLLYLEVIDQKRVNTRYLDCLENLRGLRLEAPGAGIEFGCFSELEVFIGDWHSDNHNLHRCRELRRLMIWQFQSRSPDLTDLAGIVRLEELKIVQTPITSLAGLETLDDLRYFDIAYAAKLESLDALASGQSGIREISLSNAKKIQSYRPLAAVSHLRRLKISSCAPMPDLKWMDGMNELDLFTFVETNVDDGNLTPLLSLPKLRDVGTMDKRHYNYKCNALNELLAQKAAANEANRT